MMNQYFGELEYATGWKTNYSESHSSLCFLHLFCPHQFFQQ